ncbi:lipopolysaccharide assembly protein LapA domain-containing protein [Vulcaniibacterium tengchongense]|uniref:Uncharacterized protein DUF1049 n=1 Tax=Vulcaniibacterium tengchongense TaxID=1273429 RepID=A0A3N4VX72_9GAMM|nr:lipopolysaccharide assembly protein LapA domain-containing protein [Vulcaniibacterium tengchongense]RPE81717.1 uncharacterized protein DUF1049 [Vulcaniibacterium tengchongense]
MRFFRFLIAFACLAVGAALGALNREQVRIDLGAGIVEATLGVALLAALLLGVLLGGLAVIAGVVLPLRRRLALAQRTPVERTTPGT